MAGLPKLPGLAFRDPTDSKFHLCQTFDYCNGYKIPKNTPIGIGGHELDVNTVGYIQKYDPVRYDPSLTYGRTRSVALPQFLPHYALYDQKCLTFRAFFKQSVVESAWEFYRVRIVNIIYFLEDDSITVMEPRVPNSGLDQGRLIKRGKIPKTELGDSWHWKDLAVGKDICFNGIVFHLVDCDTFTREFMRSQGLDMGDPEEMPADPYIQKRMMDQQVHSTTTPPADDKLRRFLEYDGKVLKFKALWDDRDSEYGSLRKLEVLYFLADDTIAVKEVHEKNDGCDPFPLLLRKTKLPKVYTDVPLTFPSIYLERSDKEVTEFYQPKDLKVGETMYVLGRKMLLYDCDPFTRNYYRKVLCIEQKPAIEVEKKHPAPPPKKMPPHDGLGSLEDSLQNTITVLPQRPRKDVIRQLLNANKLLRYEMKMDVVHPEDSIRKFLLLYSLAEGTICVHEPPIRNSGILGGKFLKHTLIVKPGSDRLDPDYYTPADFYIGAVLSIFKQRFIITGADLYVYRYMEANPEKFPCEVIENMRKYMFNKGFLKSDINDQIDENCEAMKKAQRDAIGDDIQVVQSQLDKCMKELKVGGASFDPEYERAKRSEILRQYEESIIHKYKVPPHGIEAVNFTCAYPTHIGDVPSTVCKEEEPCDPAKKDCTGKSASYTPKHIDTPEEIREKYYADVLKRHHDVCQHGKPVVCQETPLDKDDIFETKGPALPAPLMVSSPEFPEGACKVKTVTFAADTDRCLRDRYDLCGIKDEKQPCDCNTYGT